MDRILLTLLAVLTVACDAGTNDASEPAPTDVGEAPSAQAAAAPSVPPAQPTASPKPVPSVAQPAVPAAPAPEPAPVQGVVADAGTALTQNLGKGMGLANDFFADEPSSTAKTTVKSEPEVSPEEAPKKAKPTSCSVDTYNWKSIRLKTEESGTVKVKNGKWSRSLAESKKQNNCHSVAIASSALSDLDHDGQAEAYLVVKEEMDGYYEGQCVMFHDETETLVAFTLDSECVPKEIGRLLGKGNLSSECLGSRDTSMDGGNYCMKFDLKVSSDKLAYGRRKYGWSRGALKAL